MRKATSGKIILNFGRVDFIFFRVVLGRILWEAFQKVQESWLRNRLIAQEQSTPIGKTEHMALI